MKVSIHIDVDFVDDLDDVDLEHLQSEISRALQRSNALDHAGTVTSWDIWHEVTT